MQFTIVLAVINCSETFRDRRLKNIIKYFLLISFLTINSYNMFQYHKVLFKTGGNQYYSKYIFDYVDYIKQNNIAPIYNLNWGLENVTAFLTKGDIKVYPDLRVHRSKETKKFEDDIVNILNDNKKIYLLNIPDSFTGKWILPFKEFVKKMGYNFTEEKIFLNKINDRTIELYKIED